MWGKYGPNWANRRDKTKSPRGGGNHRGKSNFKMF